jgi:Ca2+-binding EF-hand superfamily protein
MGKKEEPSPAGKAWVSKFEDCGARKRIFIPGYSGSVHRMQETMAGTFAACSRNSHYLAYKGNHPAMEAPSLANPDEYYARRPNPRFKTNCNNRSTFTFGDDRDWNFDTIHQLHYRVPVKIPPRHESIMPGGEGASDCTKEELDRAYVDALSKIGVGGVKRLELAIRMKIEQRTTGGPMALRKAFKFFDTDASGDIDPDEFFSAMHAFGLEFTEDQVLALFGYYDVDRDGGLSYYEFIDKVLESGFGNEGKEKVMTVLVTQPEEEEKEMKSVLSASDLDKENTKKLFRKFDANNSGEIDMRELGILVKSLGLNMGSEEINNAMVDLDKDQNGAISFDEFWDWFERAAVIGIGSSQSPTKLSSSVKMKQSIRKAYDDQNQQDFQAAQQGGEVNMNRPQSSMSKMGKWMSRDTPSPGPALANSPNHLAGRMRPPSRPQTAMERGTPNTRTMFQRSKKAWGSDGWRSISRSDFRPPTAQIQPPRLNLQARRGPRPMSAQPLIREPGEAIGPVGSTSGFRL